MLGDLLHAVTLVNIFLHLDNNAVNTAESLRLGSPTVHEHTCVCVARRLRLMVITDCPALRVLAGSCGTLV